MANGQEFAEIVSAKFAEIGPRYSKRPQTEETRVEFEQSLRSAVKAETSEPFDISVGFGAPGWFDVRIRPPISPEDRARIDARTREIADDLQRLREIGEAARAKRQIR